MAEVEAILKPLTFAEAKLKQCRQDLDSKGIADASQYSRLTLRGVADGNARLTQLEGKVDSMGCKMDSMMDTWRSQILDERRKCVDENFLRGIQEKMMDTFQTSFYIMTQETRRIDWLHPGSYIFTQNTNHKSVN